MLRDGGLPATAWYYYHRAASNDRLKPGEIGGNQVVDLTLITTTIAFDKTANGVCAIAPASSSDQVGEEVPEGASITGDVFGDGAKFVRGWAIPARAAGAQRISVIITALDKA